MKESKTKRLAMLGILTATAMILSYVEVLIPPIYSAIPGIKLGLANIAVIFALYLLDCKSAALISLVRVLLCALLFGTVTSLIYSTAGAVFSLTAMLALEKSRAFSVLGVSVAGAVMHNAAQVICAAILLGTAEIGYYFIALSFSAVATGILIGVASAAIIKSVKI